MGLSKKERKKLNKQKRQEQSQDAHEQHKQRMASHEAAQKKSHTLKHWAMGGVAVVIFVLISFGTYSYFQPGYYDDFAKCLTEQGVEVYGAMSWCEYTQGQKAMFGKSFKHIDYYDYTEFDEQEKNFDIKVTPTWVVGDEFLENVQSLEYLSQQTGCPLP